MTLCLHGRAAEAREVWTKWDEADPENPVPRHMLRVGADGAAPDRATDEFVVRVFDGFAATFDDKLKELEYRAPQLATDALRQTIGEPAAKLDILDAGCGTGLCAPLLRPFARRLDGVDLSQGMLAKAGARGGYDSLTAAELTEFMSGKDSAYDVIVSADTLCYFGKLEAVFAAAARALRPGGHFVFTVEKMAETADAERCTLDFSGRFTHAESYVRAALAEAGLAVAQLTTATLRLEYFKPVAGLVVAARRD